MFNRQSSLRIVIPGGSGQVGQVLAAHFHALFKENGDCPVHHRIKATAVRRPQAVRRVGPPPPPWPSYQGESDFVGSSPSGRVTVFVDPTLGQPGLQNAQDLVDQADTVADQNDSFFGTIGGNVSVILFALGGMTDGTGGADHLGCNFNTGGNIEVCASFGAPDRVFGLFEAELSECSMGGNLCGVSTGEALSRWCSTVASNNALPDFTTGPAWAQAGMPDFVNQTDMTDQNAVSTGCGMVFISWLLSLGHTLSEIAPALVALGDTGTLAQLYESVGEGAAADAFTNFINAVQALPNDITSDNPFGAPMGAACVASKNQVRAKSGSGR